MKQVALSIVLFFCILLMHAQESTYRNPVIAGDFPDPTVIRVGDTYYAAGTSSEWAPPYRLYKSKDLVNWAYLGAMFAKMPEWTMGSYWAPELFYRNGTFYLYYTARRRSDRKSFIGVATTKDIRQGFTDHGLIVEWTNEAIDAFVAEFDGKLYITWKAYGLDNDKDIEILGAELSNDGLKTKGDAFTLLKTDTGGWEAGGMEGQCLVKHGEYIYMFYAGNACCGANCNYQTGVARAKSIRGPWEKYSGNPILHSGGQWRCPGHGTLVTTPEGRDFYLYHAYNATTNVYSGRQGMIDEVVWDAVSGWPAFRYGTIPSIQAVTPVMGTAQLSESDFVDNFGTPNLNIEWFWDVSQDKPKYRIADGKLLLEGNNSPIGTLLGLRPRKDQYTLQATLETNAVAGICIYGTKEQAVGLSVTGNTLEMWQIQQGIRSLLFTEKLSGTGNITLYLETKYGQYCQFGYIDRDGKTHPTGGPLDIKELPQWDRPPMIGIQTCGEKAGVFDAVSIRY